MATDLQRSAGPATAPAAVRSTASEPPGTGSDEDHAALAALRVVPARHPGRWLASGAVLVVVAMAVNALVTNPAWKWDVVGDHLLAPSVLRAVGTTLLLTALGIGVGFLFGTVLAVMRLSRNPLLQAVAWTYVWVFRSVPVILQLLFWYNLAILYRTLTVGVPFGPGFAEFDTLQLVSPLAAATLGLGLAQAAYSSEVVRAGLLSVDAGQLEAAAALGIPRRRQFFRIVLPQAMRSIVPTAANEVIGMVKGTSAVFILGSVFELFYVVQVIYNRNGQVIPLLLVATIWYTVITTVLSVGQYYVERHYARGAVRNLPPTPLQRLRQNVRGLRLHGLPQRKAVA
jgi:polar amino acid transport system permease protein